MSCPKSVSVNGKGKAKFDISLKFDPRDAWDEGVFDDAFVSQTEVDGWCILSDGKDTLRVGYVAVVDPASSVARAAGQGVQRRQGAQLRSGARLGRRLHARQARR